MSKVIFDGEYLSVVVNKHNYNNIYDIMKEVPYFTYDKDLSIAHLPPTRRVARELWRIGCVFDDSSKHFVEGLNKEKIDLDPRLFPYQRTGVKLLMKEGNKLLGDVMGLGKTSEVLSYLKANKDSFPCLIVTPATLKKTWEKEIGIWLGVEPYIVSGMKPYEISQDILNKNKIIIINYDILGEENMELKREEEARVANLKAQGYHATYVAPKVNGWCDYLSIIPWKTIMADEVQNISGGDSIRARGLKQICNSLCCKKIFLSGTPYETKTSQFFTALNILRPDLFPNEYAFKMRYCDPRKTRYGWKFEGISNVEELREKLSQFMIRRTREDVWQDLPTKLRKVVYLDVDKKDRIDYDNEEENFSKSLKNHHSRANMLSHISRMRGLASSAKEKSAVKWIKEWLSLNNGKLVVFVHHKKVFDFFMKEFSKMCVGINGNVPSNKRQNIVDEFQTNDKIRLFIGEIKSCGAGITLTSSYTTVFVEFGQTCVQHEQAEDRVNRIGQKSDKVFAIYLVMSDSIEESLMSTLNRHNKDMKLLFDNKKNDVMFNRTQGEWKDEVLEDFVRRKRVYRTK